MVRETTANLSNWRILMTVLAFQANDDHGLFEIANSDCELRVHIQKSDADGGYYLQGLAVDITTEEQQADGWYAFNDLVSESDAFETIGAVVPDCAWYTKGRWIFTELPDAINCAKLFADALGVLESTPTSKKEQLIADLERAEGHSNWKEVCKLRLRLNTQFPGWDDEEIARAIDPSQVW